MSFEELGCAYCTLQTADSPQILSIVGVVVGIVVGIMVSTITAVLAMFFWSGWRLGGIEAIALSILVGTSVDFLIHMMQAFLKAHPDSPSGLRGRPLLEAHALLRSESAQSKLDADTKQCECSCSSLGLLMCAELKIGFDALSCVVWVANQAVRRTLHGLIRSAEDITSRCCHRSDIGSREFLPCGRSTYQCHSDKPIPRMGLRWWDDRQARRVRAGVADPCCHGDRRRPD